MNISIVIPAYNEERRLGTTLKKILGYLKQKKFSFEIIVVDDGSRDKTAAIVQDFGGGTIKILKNEINRGKGYSVKRGMLAGQGDWLVFTDADLSTPIEELNNFLRHQEYDVIIGSRGLKDSRILARQPRWRELGGKAINFFVQALALPGVKDSQCGFKLFRKTAAQKIFERQTLNGWGFDVEILYLAKKYGFKILELPVTWLNSSETKVKALSAGLKMLWEILKIRLNDLLGKY